MHPVAFVGQVNVKQLAAGGVYATDFPFLVLKHGDDVGTTAGGQPIAGVLGLDFWEIFDLELDFPSKQLRLFAKSDCDSDAVSWPKYDKVPLEYQYSSHAYVRAALEGYDITLSLNPWVASSTMQMSAASAYLHLSASSPGMYATRVKTSDPHDRLYIFHSLQLGGTALTNVETILTGVSSAPLCDGEQRSIGWGVSLVCYDGGVFTLGANDMRSLRLYFAFHQHELYVATARAS